MGAAAERVDLRELARAAVERAVPRAGLLGGEVRYVDGGAEVPVDVDVDNIGRILDNLLNNALTYTERKPEIAVRMSVVGTRAVVRVEDNGIGIPKNQRERVFERFFRSPDPTMAKVPGIGLGLYISRGLAEGNGGKLVVEKSDPKHGTVFALTLPLAA